ncbi:MAG: amidohydrolase [Saccharospirillaceae bacterium]|nr:amidohydrolase [Saccharospirillaceae bacterium]
MKLNALPDGYLLNNKKATLFMANIITVNKKQPQAEAVAVIEGRIVAVGSYCQVENYLIANEVSFEVNNTFQDKVLTPGFIEAHMHTFMTAAFQARIYYVGQVNRTSTSGELVKASVTKNEFITRLKEVVADYESKPEAERSSWVDCWGFDPLLIQDGIELNKQLLDEICPNYPLAIVHASMHLFSVNSKGIELCGFSVDDDSHFIERTAEGDVTGNIAEMEAGMRIFHNGGINLQGTPEELQSFMIKLSEKQVTMGVTTMVDAGAGLPFDTLPLYKAVSERDDMLVRHHPYPLIESNKIEDVLEYRLNSTPMMSVKRVKFVTTDGSIQGFTAHLPEKSTYYNNHANGVIQRTEEQIYNAVLPYHKAGFNVSFHCNGNGTTEVLLNMIERLQETYPRENARHCLEHNQLVTEEQLARMKKLGVVHNLFTMHMAIWGDVHANETVGPQVVKAMEPCRSSINHGVRFSIHSDDSVTECDPLFNMWTAVNRTNIFSNITYGEHQKLTAEEALEAVTLGAAYISDEDHLKGSIEPGKLADFAILECSPMDVDVMKIKDISVLGTVLGGKVQLSKF